VTSESETGWISPKTWWIGDLSGAFADLGTFLPLVIGLLLLGDHDPSGLLVGFGVFALATGAVYRLPVPVQPMKVVAALAITGGMSAAALSASGMLIGVTLLILGLSGLIGKLDRLVPRTVLFGIQLGLGLHLVMISAELSGGHVWLTALILAALLVLQTSPIRWMGCLLLLAGSIAWSLAYGVAALPPLSVGWYVPGLVGLDLQAFGEALKVGFLMPSCSTAPSPPTDCARTAAKTRTASTGTPGGRAWRAPSSPATSFACSATTCNSTGRASTRPAPRSTSTSCAACASHATRTTPRSRPMAGSGPRRTSR
jgi:hypothetical protein